MPRQSIRRPELEAHQRALATAIDAALKRGQRGDGTPERYWKPWTNNGFAEAAQVSERSVANWRDADVLMPPADILPLLKVFYNNIDRFKSERAAMQRLWRLARGYIIDDDISNDDWAVTKSPNLQGEAVFVSLEVHKPVNWNDNTISISATLIISPDRDLSYRGKLIVVGLTEVLLIVESGAYQIAYKSRPSQRGLPNFKISAGGERIVGPLDASTGMIDGEPLGDEYLVRLELVEGGIGSTSIAIHALRDCFRVLPILASHQADGTKMPCSPNQNAVINALFFEQLRNQDTHKRAVLAHATLKLGLS